MSARSLDPEGQPSAPGLPGEREDTHALQPPLLRARGLVKRFPAGSRLWGPPRGWVHAVDDVSLHVAPGETLALVGESGCGKSTLARLLLGLLPPDAGQVELAGEDLTAARGATLRRMRRHIQLVFQDPLASLNPRRTVGDAIREGLDIHFAQLSRAKRQARVVTLLEQVGLSAAHAGRWPAELSGGQRQRVVIARALAVEPRLLVADEPTSALDVSVQAQVLNLLAELRDTRGLGFLFISHDLRVVEHVADRVAVMYLGRIVEEGPAVEVLTRPVHPYTRALVSSIPRGRRAGTSAPEPLAGEPPSPLRPPSGCSFHPRCPRFASLSGAQQAHCRGEVPVLRETGGAVGHRVACPPALAEALGNPR